jgi:hypothetical protein
MKSSHNYIRVRVVLSLVILAFWSENCAIRGAAAPIPTAQASPLVEVYPGPGVNTYLSKLYTVEVLNGSSWLSSYVYGFSRTSHTLWHQGASPTVNFTTVGTAGPTTVRISKIGSSINSADVSPKSKNIPVLISGGQAIVSLNQNDKVWVTIDNNDADPLFIFADGLKPAIPAGATYFGPGIHDIAPTAGNHYYASDNEVIYLDAGAWVRGNIILQGSSNVSVLGVGVLSGDLWTAEAVQALPSFTDIMQYAMIKGDWGGNNATVEGITIVDSPTYNFFAGTHSAKNVKLLSPWYYSTDGFQVVNHVDQSFAFVGDNVFFPAWAGVANDDVTVTNSFAGTTNNAVFCGGFWGNQPSNTYRAFVDNIDVKTYNSDAWVPYGAPLTPAVFQIWVDNNVSTMGYSNQTYQNIRVEGDLGTSLAMVKNRVYPWGGADAYDPPLGNSFNLVFKNIELAGTQKVLSEIKGFDDSNGFHNVTLQNVSINGTMVTKSNLRNFFDVNEFVTGLTVETELPPTAFLTASSTSIISGSASLLTWSTKDADWVSLNQEIGQVGESGSYTVYPAATTTYILTAANAVGTATAQVEIVAIPKDTVKPTTTITSPSNSSKVRQSQQVTIAAAASDNVGVKRVGFYVNNVLICTDSALPYSCVWKVPAGAYKTYSLQSRAYDAAGNTGVSPIARISSR